jgi:hypothetical protein
MSGPPHQGLTRYLRPVALTFVRGRPVLAAAYESRLHSGPPRPHRHAPRSGLSGRLAYGINTRIDRSLDVLDFRVIRPVPAAAAS